MLHSLATIFALFSLASLVSSASRGYSSQHKARETLKRNFIVGGVPATKNELPYQISLRVNGKHDCGASILSSYYILTAAHCVNYEDISIADYEVVAGEHDLTNSAEGTEQFKAVSRIVLHSDFDPDTRENDIAILRLSSPLTFNSAVKAVSLPPAGYTATGEALISGWGLLEEDGSSPNVLHKVRIPIITDEECRDAFGSFVIVDSMICAGIEEGGIDACRGDSGGPMIEGDLQVGVISWGAGCGRPGYPGVYTEVSHFIEWIQNNTP